jgi:general secretion pathway protein D
MVELNARKAKEINVLQRDNRIEEPTKLKQDILERLERSAPPSSSPAETPTKLP